MDSVMIIRIVAGCLALCILAIAIVYIAFLSGVLRKCSPLSRTMQPGMVWLLLIPLFNIVWSFFVVSALADSLGNEFRLRGIPTNDPKPGKTVGTAMAVFGACMIIPLLNILAFLPRMVLWIVYWVKIADFSRKLDQSPAMVGATFNPPRGTDWTLPPVGGSRTVPVFVWVLMGLAGSVPLVLILMLMAIPTIGVMKKHANEVTAINSLRTLTQAEIQYESTYPANGYACALTSLGGDPGAGAPTPASAQLIGADLGSGYKSGYLFSVTNCQKVTINGIDKVTAYAIAAVPQAVGKTGDRGFCVDQTGTILYDSAGDTNCNQTLGQ